MPSLDPTIQTKINNLRQASRDWTAVISCFEILKIDWESPEGTKYYGKTYIPAGEIDGVGEVLPMIPGEADDFFTIEQDSSLSDGEVSVEIYDGGQYNPETDLFENGGAFADLVQSQGEGIPCEIYLWFPAQELFLSVWQGHLRSEEESDAWTWRGKIANGFRSPNLDAPGRAHYTTCQAIFGGRLDTQDLIDEGGCPFNAHLPGGTIGDDSFTDCDRKSTASCIARDIDPLYHLSHATAEVTVLNNQTKGPQLYSISRGNESNLKDPVRVIMGTRKIRDCQVLAFRRDYNNNDPGKGWFAAIYEVCEGPIDAIYGAIISGPSGSINANPLHYNYRLGTIGQTAVGPDLTTHGYSGTALIRYNYGWVNPADCGPDNMRSEAFIIGLNDIRVYSDEDTYSAEYSSNRAWQIARIYCDKRWGLGNDYARLAIESWIESADWCDEVVRFVESVGGETFNWDHTRSTSNVELVGRSAQSQIEDLCKYGRLSRPYLFQNKIHISPIRPATRDELENAPVYSDKNVTGRNIIVNNGRSTLVRSTKSDQDIPNRIEATYNDADQDYKEVTLDPIEDVDQQEKAGRVQGDSSRRRVQKKHSMLGITTKAEAIKLAYWLLWFGEFGEGGIKNNLSISFKIFILDAMTLHENKIIKVESDQLTRYGFDYFRIKKLKRDSNLHVTIEAQAYNHTEETNFESTVVYSAAAPEPVEIAYPAQIEYSSVGWSDGILKIQLAEV